MKISKHTDIEDLAEVGRWQFSSTYGIRKSPKRKALLLEPRLAKLLYLLSLNMDTIVSRNYLINHIWTDTIVNEESLTRAVSDLRKILSLNFKNTFTIETIRGRGYYLVISKDRKIDIFKSKLNPNIGYLILGAFCLLVLLWSVGSAMGVVHTKFLVGR